MNRKQKEEKVSDLHQRFVKAKVAILTDFRGLDVDAMNKLRSELRKASVEYRVIKNTLIRLASTDTSIALLKDHFQGPCAIALSQDDPVLPAKIITKFRKEYPGLNLKAGMVDGRMLSVDEIQELAKLPTREVLLARLVGALSSVPGKFVQTLNGILVHFLGLLEAIKAKREA